MSNKSRTDGASSFNQVADTKAGMLGFAVSPDGDRIVFGGPTDGLFVAPADASAAPTKLADLSVSCLRWHVSGLYVCAVEPRDPFALGFAPDPTQGFVPLWHRADTCQEACASPSTLEMKCQKPWEMIAPLVDAQAAVCGASSSVRDAGMDAGSAAMVDASPVKPKLTAAAPARSTSGCSVTFAPSASTPWRTFVLMLAGLIRRSRTSSRASRST